MSNNLPKNIGNLFKEYIENLEQAPSPHVWDKLAHSLNSEPTNKKNKFDKRVLLLLLLLCLITCTGIVYQHNINIEKTNTTQQLADNKQSEKNVIEKKVDKKIAPESEQTSDNKNKEKNTPEKKKDKGNTVEQVLDKKNNKNNKTNNNFSTEKEIVLKENLFEKKYDLKKGKSKIENTGVETTDNMTIKTFSKNKVEDEKMTTKKNRSIVNNGSVKVSIHAPEAETIEREITNNEIEQKHDTATITSKNGKKNKLQRDSVNIKENKKNIVTGKIKKNSSLKNKFFISIFAAPEYANFIIGKNDNITNAYDNSIKIKEREKEIGSITAGIFFGYDINKKIALQIGFTYTMLNIESAATAVFAQKTENGAIAYRYNTSIGYTYFKPSFASNPMIGDSLKATEAEHSLEFMSVPVLLKYKIKIKKWSINPTVGITFNFLTKSILETEIKDATNREKETRTKFDGVKDISYSALLATEIQYNIYKRWSLVALPYVKYSLGAVNKNSIVETKPFFLGAGFGVNYKF